jgi:TM2 domain-containing membrane protein YozV
MANAILAAILSLIIPGLGQAYAGDITKGIILFVLAMVMLLIVSIIFKQWIYYVLDIIVCVYAAYDAYKMAQ